MSNCLKSVFFYLRFFFENFKNGQFKIVQFSFFQNTFSEKSEKMSCDDNAVNLFFLIFLLA
jgi:hypothetical protein